MANAKVIASALGFRPRPGYRLGVWLSARVGAVSEGFKLEALTHGRGGWFSATVSAPSGYTRVWQDGYSYHDFLRWIEANQGATA